MATDIRTKRSRKRIRDTIRSIPLIISGREKDPFNLHNKFWGIVTLSMFESISESFNVKSLGLTDDLGNDWHDISVQTKAYGRPAQKGDLSLGQKRATKDSTTIGLLTPNQYKQWKKIFGRIFHKNKMKIGAAKAKELAGKIAWAELKKTGANTKIDLLGNRNLLILRNTDKLFRSFLPGKLTSNSYRKYNKDQIYRVEKGAVTLGSQVDYASDVFEDRPIFPKDISPWVREASKAAVKAIINYVQVVLRGLKVNTYCKLLETPYELILLMLLEEILLVLNRTISQFR